MKRTKRLGPATRKTFNVQSFKEECNRRIACASSEDARQAIASLCSHVLMESGQYHGFNYVKWMDGGFDQWTADGRPTEGACGHIPAQYIGDETLIRYY